MCTNCDEFSAEVLFGSADEFRDLVSDLDRVLSSCRLFLAFQSCHWGSIQNGPPFGSDPVIVQFRCGTCEQLFQLDYSAYPGVGGSWVMIDEENL